MSILEPAINVDEQAAIRNQFPALAGETIYLENAGGSQVPAGVANAIRDYMLTTYVQLDAGYAKSKQSTAVVHAAHAFMNRFVNGEGIGEAILGPSTTALVRILAECYTQVLQPGDVILLAESAHEANYGPWKIMAANHGIEIRNWHVDPNTHNCRIEDLQALLADGRTRIVAFPQVSNLLGEIVDVKQITEIAHAAGAQVVVDGVAYAPHRAIDVKEWGVDWYLFSNYKVYGPHIATLFGTHNAIKKITGPNHFFVPKEEVPYKFEPGGVAHESCAGLLGFGEYLEFLADLRHENASSQSTGPPNRQMIEQAWTIMAEYELPLQQRLIEFLQSKSSVQIIGPAHGEASRVATVSFVHERLSAPEIVEFVDLNSTIGIRFGHMYAYHLAEALGINIDDGVVRISAVHYNTMAEVNKLCTLLDQIL